MNELNKWKKLPLTAEIKGHFVAISIHE